MVRVNTFMNTNNNIAPTEAPKTPILDRPQDNPWESTTEPTRNILAEPRIRLAGVWRRLTIAQRSRLVALVAGKWPEAVPEGNPWLHAEMPTKKRHRNMWLAATGMFMIADGRHITPEGYDLLATVFKETEK